MTETAPEYVAASETLHEPDPWIWLFTVRLDEIRRALRICQAPQNVTWPASSGHVYYARSLDFDGLETSSQSSGRKTTVQFFGMDPVVHRLLADHRAFVDRTVVIRKVHAAHLHLTTPRLEVPFRVANVTRKLGGIAWELGMPRKWDQTEPHRFYDPEACAWVYGDERCGCNLGWPGCPQVCDYTKDGPNGCKAKGQWEDEHGYPVLHPGRYGGFPSAPIPRQ